MMKFTFPPFLAAVAASVFLAGCAFTLEKGDTRFYALIIGVESYDSIPSLSYCVDDATAIHASLTAHGWSPADITVLTDGLATKANILSAIASIVSVAGAKDYLFLYYSGHGTAVADTNHDEADGYDEAIAPVDAGYLPPPDDALIDVNTLILDDELRDLFDGARTEKGLIVFDSCNSGGVINKGVTDRSAGPYGASTRSVSAANPGARGSGGRGVNGDLDIFNFPVLVASGQDEFAWEEGPPLEHGVFTYFLLGGLENLKADANHDGKVSVRELFRYAEIHTESFAELRLYSQHPQIRFSRDFIDILVTR
jgi:uncharacterized caspase-like protein